MELVVVLTVAAVAGLPLVLAPRRKRVAPVRLDPYLTQLNRLSAVER
ncbi:MAG: hypothetical protein AAGA99_00810 [Actinomycetota bacterium]